MLSALWYTDATEGYQNTYMALRVCNFGYMSMYDEKYYSDNLSVLRELLINQQDKSHEHMNICTLVLSGTDFFVCVCVSVQIIHNTE